MRPLFFRILASGLLASALSAAAVAQYVPTSVNPGGSAYPGTYLYGDLQSLSVADTVNYGMSTQSAQSLLQASFETNFSLGTRTGAATLRVVTSAATSVVTHYSYAWNPATSAYELVSTDAMNNANTVYTFNISLTAAQMAKYTDASGNVRILQRVVRPTRLGTTNFNWLTDLLQIS